MKRLNSDYLFYGIFFVISILVLWNLMKSGYILTLDMIFTDKTRILDILYGIKKTPSIGIIFTLFITFLNIIFPVWFIQKIILFSILFFSGVFAYQCSPTDNKLGKFFAGLVYMINPFIFVRFLAGHLLLLIGYMFLPLLFRTFINFFEKPDFKTSVKIVFLLTLTSLAIHFIPIIFGIFGFFLIINFLKGKDIRLIKYSILIVVGYLLLNFYWIFPLIMNPSTGIKSFEQYIGPADVSLFSPKPSFNFNTLFNLASMHGFWRQGYDYAKFHIPFWYILYIVILFLTVHGFLILNKHRKYGIYAKSLAIIAIASLILATGITHPFFSKIFNFLFENIPFFKGYREPHKFVALLCLIYSFFGGVGLGDFVKQFKQSKKKISKTLLAIFLIICLATPIIYSYTMFFGFHDQLETVDYPKTWYELDDYLNNDEDDFNVLFLPWHMYMDFRFNPKQRIANPASAFFTKPIIQGDNMEAGGIYSQSTNPISKYIEFLLSNNQKYNNFGELVKPLNIKYIILAKEVDWHLYTFLINQTDLELVIDNEDLLVFKNNHETSPVYETNTLLTKDDWNDLINNTSTLDLTPIETEKKSPIKYIFQEEPTKRYLVFSERFSDGWRYGKQKPEQYLGAINVFEASKETTIYYQRFNCYLTGYIISGITLLVCVGYLIYEWKKIFFNKTWQKVIFNKFEWKRK